MNTTDQQHKHFQQLLEQVSSEIGKLKHTNRKLHQENARLKTKLEEIEAEQNDVFSSITESERIAMKNRINGLITKIDRHLND